MMRFCGVVLSLSSIADSARIKHSVKSEKRVATGQSVRAQGVGDNSCRYAKDGACDEPIYCDYGTDATDCGRIVDPTGEQAARCPWLTATTVDNQLECADGTTCVGTSDPKGWACCKDHGGRAKCPSNMPSMCSIPNSCSGGSDFCCSADFCQWDGGIRPCDEEPAATPPPTEEEEETSPPTPQATDPTPAPSGNSEDAECDMTSEENTDREAVCVASESTSSGRSPTWNAETCSCNCDKDAESQCKNHIVNGIWHADECYCSTPTQCSDGWARMACLNEDADGSGIAYWKEEKCECARCPRMPNGKQMTWDKAKGKCSGSVCPEGQKPYFGSCVCDQRLDWMRTYIRKCMREKGFDWDTCKCKE